MESTIQPLISVIIPTRNVNNLIDPLMECLKNQTIGFENLQIIFVDDCSSDDTFTTLLKYRADNVEVYQLSEHLFQGAARNRGIEHAKADYIMFIDADDYISDDACKILYDRVEEYHPDLIVFGWQAVPSKPDYSTEPNVYTEFLTAEERLEFFKAHNKFITRGCWDKLYSRKMVMDYNMRFAAGLYDEESLFTTPAYLLAKSIYLLNNTLYFYDVNRDDSTSNQLKKDNTWHKDDNARVWLATYDYCKEYGLIEKNHELFEWWFVVNFLLYSIGFNKERRYELSFGEKHTLYEYTIKLFPNYEKNKTLREKHAIEKINQELLGG